MNAFNTSTWETGGSQSRAAAGRSLWVQGEQVYLVSSMTVRAGVKRPCLKRRRKKNERKKKGLCSLSNSINTAFCVKK